MKIMNFNNLNTAKQKICIRLIAVISLVLAFTGSAIASELVNMSVSNTSKETAEVRMVFDSVAPSIEHFIIDNPAKLSVDLVGSTSGLDQRSFNYTGGLVTSAFVLPVEGKVRVVFSLNDSVQFKLNSSNPNELVLVLGHLSAADVQASVQNDNVVADLMIDDELSEGVFISDDQSSSDKVMSDVSSGGKPMVQDIDFKRAQDGSGQIFVQFNSSKINSDIITDGSDIVAILDQVMISDDMIRRLDVVSFGTPVQTFETRRDANGASIVISAAGDFEQISYRIENQLVIEFKPLTVAEADNLRKEKFPFTGKKINMNFQKIKVYEALNILAQYNNLNLVADNVEGEISLKLDDVPWDQALDVILKIKGLDKRISKNVMIVANADKLAEDELKKIEIQKQAIELQPLFTKYIKLNYAKPDEIRSILMNISTDQGNGEAGSSAGASFVSARGTLSIDDRTKTLIVNDTAENITRIQEAVRVFDVPSKQVSIEARVVVARTSIGRELGVQWGTDIAPIGLGGTNNILLGGNLTTTNDMRDGAYSYNAPDSLTVGLPAAVGSQNYAFGIASNNFALDLELSALETAGKAEVVSQPKIVTVDNEEATILSGQQVPYRSADGTIAFRDAGLSLTVTPRITPDNSMFLKLTVTQDSVGAQTSDGLLIDTNKIETQVLVKNGDTLVLGGVYRVESVEQKEQVPFLGNLPIIGNLFKRSTMLEEKNELLVFITPRLIDDGLVTQ